MEKKTFAAIAAVGISAAIAVPTIAFGNARSNENTGVVHRLAVAQTPLVTRLTGAQEVPAADPDGSGGASVTFDLEATTPDVCWDLAYSNITGTPTNAHIHGPAAAGATAPPVIPFDIATLGANSASGCRALTAPEQTIAADILAHPEMYYVNVHTTDFPNGAIRGQLSMGAMSAGATHILTTPVRAYDSRSNNGAPIGINEVRTIDLATGLDASGNTTLAVPPGATAAIVTLTVTETTVGPGGPGGFLSMYNADLTTVPATSSINWSSANQNIAVTAQVSVNAAGQIKVRDGSNATHFVVDVIGYLF
jgi:hypothetical protein